MGDSTTYTCNTHGLCNYDCAECAQEERNEIVAKLADDAEVNRILRVERDALKARLKEAEMRLEGDRAGLLDRAEAAEARVKELEASGLKAELDSLQDDVDKIIKRAEVAESALKAEQEAHRATKAEVDAWRDTPARILYENMRAKFTAAEARASRLAAALEKVLASATPHPVEHPSMTKAWTEARAALADSAAEAPRLEKAHRHEKRGGHCPACEAKR